MILSRKEISVKQRYNTATASPQIEVSKLSHENDSVAKYIRRSMMSTALTLAVVGEFWRPGTYCIEGRFIPTRLVSTGCDQRLQSSQLETELSYNVRATPKIWTLRRSCNTGSTLQYCSCYQRLQINISESIG